MAYQHNPESNEHELSKVLVSHTLASWRFLLLMALIPLLWAIFCASGGLRRSLITAGAGIVIYQCWRLWLDNHYFSELTQENNRQAGIILTSIWQKQKLQDFTLEQRYQGALKQLKYSLISCALLWLIWIITLLFK
ncbi:hypothetical protein BGI03_00940 [Snodgrassella alvi]|uniref:hypothetical protein n=1 Tax=Snodgrassella alvi TaxID=1196083 RepID=UPI000A064429|nr:hypothetical protein [Snodgrassella alvi]ORF06850.1 hypothetical protein BGH98_05310 [Snodgrassella alvi]ORF16262.1 hypothetical protein BGI01_00820 [Snodgrassella alvi]ORF19587.1 hypothetical protein BGI04_06325 [Snodgrassella alvi]ORF21825.1 hypothetical protein BGI03_00940 [Snodgrassella alvi]